MATAKFKLSKSKNGQFKFNLHAKNSEIILTGSESYTTREAALNGIESVRKNAAKKENFEVAVMKSKVADAPKQTYFRLKSGNGQIIGKSEMYKSDSGRRGGIKSVMTNAPGAELVDETGA